MFSSILGTILYIRHAGVVSEQEKQNKIAIKSVKIHEKISKDIMALSDSELDKRLLKWRRD